MAPHRSATFCLALLGAEAGLKLVISVHQQLFPAAWYEGFRALQISRKLWHDAEKILRPVHDLELTVTTEEEVEFD